MKKRALKYSDHHPSSGIGHEATPSDVSRLLFEAEQLRPALWQLRNHQRTGEPLDPSISGIIEEARKLGCNLPEIFEELGIQSERSRREPERDMRVQPSRHKVVGHDDLTTSEEDKKREGIGELSEREMPSGGSLVDGPYQRRRGIFDKPEFLGRFSGADSGTELPAEPATSDEDGRARLAGVMAETATLFNLIDGIMTNLIPEGGIPLPEGLRRNHGAELEGSPNAQGGMEQGGIKRERE